MAGRFFVWMRTITSAVILRGIGASGSDFKCVFDQRILFQVFIHDSSK